MKTGRAGETWFAARGWRAFRFQREVWRAIRAGRSGLLHATTGAGKTYAVWLGILEAFSAFTQQGRAQPAIQNVANELLGKGPAGKAPGAPPLTVLWITPMRALAADTLRALVEPLAALGSNWSAGARSGDTGAAERSAPGLRSVGRVRTRHLQEAKEAGEQLPANLTKAEASEHIDRLQGKSNRVD